MAETKGLIIIIISYILAIVSPILGLIAGIIIYFTQKENPFLRKHGKFVMIVAILMWVITAALIFAGILPAFF